MYTLVWLINRSETSMGAHTTIEVSLIQRAEIQMFHCFLGSFNFTIQGGGMGGYTRVH